MTLRHLVQERSAETRDLISKARSLPQRIRDLEAAVQENRQLNRRVAELIDVVTELLIPIADRDEERVRALLAEYRSTTLAP